MIEYSRISRMIICDLCDGLHNLALTIPTVFYILYYIYLVFLQMYTDISPVYSKNLRFPLKWKDYKTEVCSAFRTGIGTEI